jgi:hypothetical protein
MARSGGLRRTVIRWLGVGVGLLTVGLVADAVTAQGLAAHISAQAAQRAHSIAESVSESSPPTELDAWLVEPDWCPALPGTASVPDAQPPDQCEAPGRSMPAAPVQLDAPINTLAAVMLDNRVPRCEELSVDRDYALCAWPAPGKSNQAVVVASPLAMAGQLGVSAGVVVVVIGAGVLLAARLIRRSPPTSAPARVPSEGQA